MRLPMLKRADAPTTQDLLEVAPYAEALARFILDCETPMAVALQGEWGSGKSSLMRMVEEKLRNTDEYKAAAGFKEERAARWKAFGRKRSAALPVHIAWFETWQFAMVDPENLGHRLLEALLNEIAAAVPRKDGALPDGLAEKAKGLLVGLGAAAAQSASGGLIDAAQIKGAFGPGTVTADVRLASQKRRFEEFVRLATIEMDVSRLVIFVDDLDRVRPDHAVSMLEVLKNFMDVAGCVFVLACDYEVVCQGVEQKFGISDPFKQRAFFDKIIQVPFDVPVHQYNISGLLRDFLEGKGIGRGKGTGLVLHAKSLAEWPAFDAHLAPMVQIAVGQNPRAFKRFLNSLDLLASVARAAHGAHGGMGESLDIWKDHKKWLALVSLVAMQVRWPTASIWLTDCEETGARSAAADLIERLGRLMSGEDEEAAAQLALVVGREDAGEGAADVRGEPEVAALDDFLQHLLALLDTNHDGQLDDEEMAALVEISGYLRVTQHGKPPSLSGKEQLRRRLRALGPDGVGLFYLELLHRLEALRAPLSSKIASAPYYPDRVFFQALRLGSNQQTRSFLRLESNGRLTAFRTRAGALEQLEQFAGLTNEADEIHFQRDSLESAQPEERSRLLSLLTEYATHVWRTR